MHADTDTKERVRYVLPLADERAILAQAGGKGASLARLAAAELPVPDGFHVTTAVYRQIVTTNDLQPRILAALEGTDPTQPATLDTASQTIQALFAQAYIPEDVATAIAHAYRDLPGDDPVVAVRSSATAEDLPGLSFAGQQETYLNIQGETAVLEAVRRCWASLWTPRAIGYRMRNEIDQNVVSLAVVVQLLIPADAAGILFTANPVNGRRAQAMISAAWGLGEAVVGGLVTPDSLIVEKANGRVQERQTADKQLMTVRVDGGTEERPVPKTLRHAPVLDDEQAAALVRLGVQIEELYGMPMDIEWALLDGEFAILQARPITALPEETAVSGPEPDIAIEWTPPDPKGTYMRGSVADLMPNPLSPLFVSLGIPTMRKQMIPLGKRMTRIKPTLADDYFTAINNFAYMNARMPPKTWWWILVGLIPAYPRMLSSGIATTWRDEFLPEYRTAVAEHQDKVLEMAANELWQSAQQILDATMYYVCGLMFATMGASAGSEMLLTKVYDKFAKQDGDPPATALLMGWDNIPVRAEKSLYDLAAWCREHEHLAGYVLETPAAQLAGQLTNEQPPAGIAAEDWQELQDRFAQHMKLFGHVIFQLDFAEPLPLDHPRIMLENVKMYLRGEGANPHERQQASETKRIQTTETMLNRLKGLKLWAFRKALNWGQTLAEVREDALAEIGVGYPLLRQMLLELGGRLAASDVIQQANDIFYLEKDEIDTCVANWERGTLLDALSARVAARKAFEEKLKQVTPPMMPVKERVMGVKADLFVSAAAEDQSDDMLGGVAASPGKITAPACVLRGPEDFGQMRPGDVLVAGTTTPAWTPLFTMATAVVTDIGGPLSHGSIVAREYGIPAVMGTGIATQRICSGQMITVDGDAGTVTLENRD
jgi:rifampicin phosphotransferase